MVLSKTDVIALPPCWIAIANAPPRRGHTVIGKETSVAKHHTTTESGSAGAAAARVVEHVKKAPKPIEPAGSSGSAPGPDQIARLAYSYWQARGCPEGSPEEDWLRAEAELHDQNR
jgi:hypothetical protein